jgi:NAD(P)-dependent dehydrogenase (short-subunit alcohol dehydrogenase family)
MGEQLEAEIARGMANKIDLTGQVALVTGAGRGIGRAIALALRDAGAAVAVCSRSEAQIAAVGEELAAGGGEARSFSVDVADRDAVERMVAQVGRELGPVDLLVNNAAVLMPIGAFVATDPDDCWRAIEINLRGPVCCSRAVLPQMLARGHGRIVNVSSGGGFRAFPMMSSYVVSKTALWRLTETLDAETTEHGVRMFAIHPGFVLTNMAESLKCGEPSTEQLYQDLVDAGIDPPERPAQMVVFLASGEADALAGRCLNVNDDLPDMVARVAEIEEQDLYALRLRVPADGRS